MLDIFRKGDGNKHPFQNWKIPVDASYRLLTYRDSIQFINESKSQVLYFSVFVFSGNSLLQGEILQKMESAVSPSENEWHLKGVRQGGNEILNCVFTFTNECDKEQMKELFENIVYIAK